MSTAEFLSNLDKIRENAAPRKRVSDLESPKRVGTQSSKTPTFEVPINLIPPQLTESFQLIDLSPPQPVQDLTRAFIPNNGVGDNTNSPPSVSKDLREFEIKKDLTSSDILEFDDIGSKRESCPEGYEVVIEKPNNVQLVSSPLRESLLSSTVTTTTTTTTSSSTPKDTTIGTRSHFRACGNISEEFADQLALLQYVEVLEIAEIKFREEWKLISADMSSEFSSKERELYEYKYSYIIGAIRHERVKNGYANSTIYVERKKTALGKFIETLDACQFLKMFRYYQSRHIMNAVKTIGELESPIDSETVCLAKLHLSNMKNVFYLIDNLIFILILDSKEEREESNKFFESFCLL